MSSSQLEAQQRQMEAHEVKQARLCLNSGHMQLRAVAECFSVQDLSHSCASGLPTRSSCDAAQTACLLWAATSLSGRLLARSKIIRQPPSINDSSPLFAVQRQRQPEAAQQAAELQDRGQDPGSGTAEDLQVCCHGTMHGMCCADWCAASRFAAVPRAV